MLAIHPNNTTCRSADENEFAACMDEGGAHGRRHRRRADRRGRRIRRRRRLESGRDANADRLPRAGRLDESRRISRATGRDWEMRAAREFQASVPNLRKRPADYPVNDDDSPIAVRQLQRRRRQHDPLLGALPALPSVGLPGEVPGRRRRRLAHRLRHPRPLLRRKRPQHRRLAGLAGDPAIPAHQPPSAARADGAHGRDDGARFQQARLALVAIGQRHRHAPAQRPRPVPEPRSLQRRLRPGREEQCRHRLLADGRTGRRRAPNPLPGARDHRRPPRHGDRRHVLRRRTASNATNAPRSSSWRATASARRGFCSTPSRRDSPNGLANRSGLVGRNLMLHPWGHRRRGTSTNPWSPISVRRAAAS